jgi:hypothetical protein
VTNEEADRIFRAWQAYLETADRFSNLMLTPPESFLPYPVEELQEALNIVAQRLFDAGDHETAEDIQRLMALHLGGYYMTDMKRRMTDEEALLGMKRQIDLMVAHSELMQTLLEKLKESQKSWMAYRTQPEGKLEAMTDREAAERFYSENPAAAFDVAMGQRGTHNMGFAVAVYVKVCEEIEKSDAYGLMAKLMNSLDNMDLSAEAQRRGFRNRLQAIEAGKEVRRARVKALEDRMYREAHPGVLDRLTNHIKKLF